MSIVKSTAKKASKRRTRRSPEAARENILTAAEALLLEKGPQALKLTDVAAKAGIAHATVLHHFGTIGEVQAALMERMIRQLVAQVQEAHQGADDAERPQLGARALFDAFEAKGAARLAAWLELTGEVRRLTMVREAVRTVLAERKDRSAAALAAAEDHILMSIVLAIGVGLSGRTLAQLLGRPPGTTRDLALELLRSRLPLG
jgi:AcrR family transcriptional regulator